MASAWQGMQSTTPRSSTGSCRPSAASMLQMTRTQVRARDASWQCCIVAAIVMVGRMHVICLLEWLLAWESAASSKVLVLCRKHTRCVACSSMLQMPCTQVHGHAMQTGSAVSLLPS